MAGRGWKRIAAARPRMQALRRFSLTEHTDFERL
jgi:hypothetical protein